tara:strand:+ start:60 stop:419 length:360 start_codon:yes stop_codon:yes gene_type:complete
MNKRTEKAISTAVQKLVTLRAKKNGSQHLEMSDKYASVFNTELASDKIGYKLADAQQLEEALESLLNNFKSKEAYSKSNTMKTIERHSDDQVKPKRSVSDVLNSCNELASQLVTIVNKK